jgi:hypothetical protein
MACVTQPPPESPPKAEPAAPVLPSNASGPGLGGIKIASRPPGANVLLIPEDEAGGAGLPKPRGTTPTTITDLIPGRYTVHLELVGYKSFQKTVEVKPDETVPLVANLSRR